MMRKNYSKFYSRQIGEHLVVAELGRRGIAATPFAGNIPEIDLLAYRDGKSIPLQVKANRRGSWSLQMNNFCEISFEGDKQVIGRPDERPYDQTVYVFVAIGEQAAQDRFYILRWEQIRDISIKGHRAFLQNHNGVRPKNPKSLHKGIGVKDLEEFIDNWSVIDRLLEGSALPS